MQMNEVKTSVTSRPSQARWLPGVSASRAPALLVLLCIWASPGCSPQARPPDILLITCDTLRPDHLGIYGYDRDTSPHLDRLFQNGAIFERSYTTEANTPPSVVSLLSGLYPQEHGVRIFYQRIRDDVQILPDLLPDTYQTAAFVSNVVLTDEAMGIAKRFDHYDDFVDEQEPLRPVYERRGERTSEAALAWLESEWDVDRPLFLWVHYIDPHGPYLPPEDTPASFDHEGTVPMEKDRIQSYQAEAGVTDALDYVDRYDEEIAHFDAALGALMEGYSARRPIEAALLLFTADHGESMIEHEKWFTHGYQVYEEIIRVPLLLSGPGVEPGRHSTPVSGVDVVPTLLRASGAPRPDNLPGVELQGAIPAGRVVEVEAFQSTHAWRAAIVGDSKWAFSTASSGVLRTRFYDLSRDPGELAAQTWEEAAPPPEGQLERALADPDRLRNAQSGRGTRGTRISGPKIDPRVNERQLEQLRALGYVEDN
jgi:arylsulfatase A-like enzyme